MAKASGKLPALLSADYRKHSAVDTASPLRGDFLGPPVPDGFAAEMLAPISESFPRIIAANPSYKYYLFAINPDARSVYDFVRSWSQLPVYSYNAMGYLVSQVLRHMSFVGPKLPRGFVADIIDPIAKWIPSIVSTNPAYTGRLASINPKARRLYDFLRPHRPLAVDSHSALLSLVHYVQSRTGFVGPRLPSGFTTKMIMSIAEWSQGIVSSNPLYTERLASINPRAQRLNDFLHPSSPLPVDSYSSLHRLVQFVKRRMNFVGPRLPSGFVQEILGAWARRGVEVRAIGDHPFLRRKVIRQINSDASSFDDFFGPQKIQIYSHNAFRAIVDECLGSLTGPPLPPGFAREVLQPLVDQGIDLERAGMHMPEFALWFIRIKGNIPNPIKSLADIYIGEIPCALASHNGLRRLTSIIIQDANKQRNIARKHAALQASFNPPDRVPRIKQTSDVGQIDGQHQAQSNQNAAGKSSKKGASGHLHLDPAGSGLHVRLATKVPPTEAEWQSMREGWDF